MRPCRRLGMGRCCWTCFAQIVCCSLLCMVQNWYLQAQGCYMQGSPALFNAHSGRAWCLRSFCLSGDVVPIVRREQLRVHY